MNPIQTSQKSAEPIRGSRWKQLAVVTAAVGLMGLTGCVDDDVYAHRVYGGRTYARSYDYAPRVRTYASYDPVYYGSDYYDDGYYDSGYYGPSYYGGSVVIGRSGYGRNYNHNYYSGRGYSRAYASRGNYTYGGNRTYTGARYGGT